MALVPPSPESKTPNNIFFRLLEDLWLPVVLLLATAALGWWVNARFTFGGPLWLAFRYLVRFGPIWLPLLLFYIWWKEWLYYLRSRSVAELTPVLLEIKLPREVLRSPLAMEVIFSHLYQTGAASHLEQYWEGKLRPWFSLELCSLGGSVRFFVYSPDRKWRDLVEAQFYAQYPEAVITEVPDYTDRVSYDFSRFWMWGTYFSLIKDDVYPLKTYIDYGLDKPAEEEEKVDPLTATLEYLGSLKPHEQCWIQILIQAHKKEDFQGGFAPLPFTEKPNWKGAAEKEIEKIREAATPKPKKEGQFSFPNPTKGQVEKIAALERSIAKYPFKTMIRTMYVTTTEGGIGPASIPGLIASVRQYNSQELNGLKLGWFTDHSDFVKDLRIIFSWFGPFQRYLEERANVMRRQMLDAYKRRSFFYPPYKNFHAQPFILNSEELATMFHLPGRVATTPTLQKVESKRAEAPSNLPL